MTQPKVTVLVSTYNHERFLGDALESALAQRAPFPFEVLVADDASTDETGRIATAFRDRHPDVVRVVRPEKNLGANAMFLAAIAEVRGEYVALLDGDDAWLGTDKLARQAAFLDAKVGTSGCFHDATVVYDDGSSPPRQALAALRQPILTLPDIVIRYVVPTASLMYRHIDAVRMREWFQAVAGEGWERIISIDWLLSVLLASRGPLVYLDGLDAIYRVHGGGVWSSTGRLAQLAGERVVYRRMARLLPREVQPAVVTGLLRCAVETAVEEAGVPHDRPVAIAGPALPTPWYLNGRTVVHVSSVDAEAAHQLDALRAGVIPTRSTGERHFGSLPPLPATDDIAAYLVVTEPRGARPGRAGLWAYTHGLTCLSADGTFSLFELPAARPPKFVVTETMLHTPVANGLVGANIERPSEGSSAIRSFRLIGWVLPLDAPARRVVVRDADRGHFLATAPVDIDRPDLAAAYTRVPHAATAGFSLDVVLSDEAGPHHLLVSVELTGGTQIVLGAVGFAHRITDE